MKVTLGREILRARSESFREKETITNTVHLDGNTLTEYLLTWIDVWRSGKFDARAFSPWLDHREVWSSVVAFEYIEGTELAITHI